MEHLVNTEKVPEVDIDAAGGCSAGYSYINRITGEKCVLSALYAGETAEFQDGACFGDYLFRLNKNGDYRVYTVGTEITELFSGRLDCADDLVPHSNAVFFGTEKYRADDEFPLLYSNIYNNYKKDEDRKEGLLCVYRVTRDGCRFATELVRLIKIDFVSEKGLWRSADVSDVRPYGNFAIDDISGRLYAFVPIDGEKVTRVFAFEMPDGKREAQTTEVGGRQIGTAVLTKDDILDSFDFAYSNYPQGATIHGGVLYSLEGFNYKPESKAYPRLKAVDTAARQLICDIPLYEIGLRFEPELITFDEDSGLLYSDNKGTLFRLDMNSEK